MSIHERRTMLLAGALFLLSLSLLVAGCALFDGGSFFFTLDDPYIHLALAEKLAQGHYGINFSEASAPSSSIGYPWLLIPGIWLGMPVTWALVLNASALTLVTAILGRRFGQLLPDRGSHAVLAAMLASYALGLIAMPLLGMEHGLHVLFTLLAFEGLLRARSAHAPWWLPPVLAACVGMRFEGLALSAMVVLTLLLWGDIAVALFSVAMIGSALLAHFAYMKSLGLPLLPSSVLAKSEWVANAEAGHSIRDSVMIALGNLTDNVLYLAVGQALVLAVMVTLLLAWQAWRQPASSGRKNPTWLWLTVAGTLLAHLAGGRMGWFNRYEIYAMVLASAALLVASTEADTPKRKRMLSGALVVVLALCGIRYTWGYVRIPWASHNISEQQYLMHRFAVDFYQAPVAVNDLGWVAFGNRNYVLDLIGLGSEKARRAALADNRNYAGPLAHEYGVGLAMIYKPWFEGRLPDSWRPMAELRLTTKAATVGPIVTFFMTPDGDSGRVVEALRKMRAAYPQQFFLLENGQE